LGAQSKLGVNSPDQLTPGGARYNADNQVALLKLNRSNTMTVMTTT